MTAYVNPTPEQFGAMAKLDEPGPIHMLNLLAFREKAAYADDHPFAEKGLSGAEAYQAYGAESGPIFQAVGGRIAFAWTPRVTVIGPEDERWDMAFVAEYPTVGAFIDMVKNPDYQVAVAHRNAAIENSRLIRLRPEETGAGFAG
ncbi:MAG: DUF1330 domain-containing protein [Pseudomonadota bacterium]